jgi:hypothetical protein
MVSGFHLWFALIGLYLLESVRITIASAIVFRRRLFSTAWSATHPLKYPGAERWGWILAPLLPASGPDIVAQDFVVAYSPAQAAPNSALVAGNANAIAYAEIASVTIDDNFLCVNGAKFVRCQSVSLAHQIKDQIEQLRKVSADSREQTIRRFINSALRPGAREQLQSLRTSLRGVTALVAALWLVAFVVLPVALLIAGNDLVLVPIAVLIWSLAFALAFIVPKARKRIDPSVRRRFPWESLKYVVYPVAAMRAREDLVTDRFVDMHPLALCMELCADTERVQCATELLLRIRHPATLPLVPDHDVDTVSNWFNRLLTECLEKHLAEIAPEILNNLIPLPLDPSCVSYCPRCRSQYRILEGACADCAGVFLQPFNRPAARTSG